MASSPGTRSLPPSPSELNRYRQVVLFSFVALTVLGMVWEFWLAPLRPGGSMLALKVLPLALSLPALRASRLRAYQAWSMGILLYVCEGLVRATSDQGLSVSLAILETGLALIAFAALLMYSRGRRLQAGHRPLGSTPSP